MSAIWCSKRPGSALLEEMTLIAKRVSVDINNYTSVKDDVEASRTDTIETIIEEVLEVPVQAGNYGDDRAQEPQEPPASIRSAVIIP